MNIHTRTFIYKARIQACTYVIMQEEKQCRYTSTTKELLPFYNYLHDALNISLLAGHGATTFIQKKKTPG